MSNRDLIITGITCAVGLSTYLAGRLHQSSKDKKLVAKLMCSDLARTTLETHNDIPCDLFDSLAKGIKARSLNHEVAEPIGWRCLANTVLDLAKDVDIKGALTRTVNGFRRARG